MEDVLQFFSQPVSLIEIVLAVVVVRPICRAIRARAGLKRLRRDEAFAPARRRRRLSPENVVAESEHLAQQPDGDQATADRHDGDTVDTYEHPDSPGGGAASDNLQLSESESESAADPSQQIESQSDQQAEHIDHEHTDHEHTDHEQPEAEQAQQADSGEGGNDSGDTSVYMLQQMSRNFAQEYNVSEDFHGWTAKLERRKDGTRTLDPYYTPPEGGRAYRSQKEVARRLKLFTSEERRARQTGLRAPAVAEVRCGELMGDYLGVHENIAVFRVVDGDVMFGQDFEQAAGRGHSRKWRESIVLTSGPSAGKPISHLLEEKRKGNTKRKGKKCLRR